MKFKWRTYVTAILLALVFGVWYGILRNHEGTKKSEVTLDNLQGTILSAPRALSDFSLIDDNNQVFTNNNLKNKWSFLFFGFTRCHSICPTTLAEMKQVFDALPKGKFPAQMIMITVDPDNDTPAQLKNYLSSFNPVFIGVTGSEETLSTVRQELGILAYRNDNASAAPNAGADLFDHSGTIILINPEGQFYAVFSMPHKAEEIVQDFTQIQKSYKG